MNKLHSLKDFSFKNNNTSEENLKTSEIKNEPEKVLCKHCGRTSSNGIRCLGMCVADSEY